jgi:hypothetical protein
MQNAAGYRSAMDQFMVVLVNGERRRLELPARSGTVGNALDRLDHWIATIDGGWVNKQHVVEVWPVLLEDEHQPGNRTAPRGLGTPPQ